MALRYFLFLRHRLFAAASLSHPKAFLFLVALLFDKILSKIWWKMLQGGRPCKPCYSITCQGRFQRPWILVPEMERLKTCLFPLGNVSTSLHEASERIWTVAAGGGNWARAPCHAYPQLNFLLVVVDYSGSFIILSVTIWESMSSKSWLHLMRCALNLSA